MAIDLSTHIAGNSTPEGILYSAGRDGLVIAWELGAPTKPRRREPREPPATGRVRRRGDWKAMTGWDEDQDLSDEESISTDEASALDLNEGFLDGMYNSAPRATSSPRTALSKSIPYEQRWQIDSDRIDDIEPVRLTFILSRFIPLKKFLQHSSFRQCVQSHNDWINDITLCNFNQNGKRPTLPAPPRLSSNSPFCSNICL
jgi:WD repeat-containing protein 48